jgi:hypothetical protein
MIKYNRKNAGSTNILVIPTGEIKEEDLAAIAEDMRIMSRIFDKKMAQARLAPAGGIDELRYYWFSDDKQLNPFLTSQKHITEALYLGDYGVVFLMSVDFPLSAPPKATVQKKTNKETDEVWAQTKQEIYNPVEIRRKTKKVSSPSQKYDAEKVENLKTTLLKALKHVANIRNLKPDDSVILTVNSPGAAMAPYRLTGEDYTSNKAVKTDFDTPAALSIRAVKSDVDAYSKGDLELHEFRKKVVTFIY